MRELYHPVPYTFRAIVGIFIYIYFSLSSTMVKGQVPEGYYDGLETLEGDLLKLGLHNLLRDHIEYPYTSSSTDVWDILKETDAAPGNPENVVLFYTGWLKNGEAEYDRGQGWTREHVWAKSHGDFGIDRGAGTDVHALRPADVTVNSARNNKDFDEGGETYQDGDGPTLNRTDSDSWEPRDIVKGDVARTLFYMAVRYEGSNGEPDLELVDSVNSVNSNQPGLGFHGNRSALLKWHYQDPVDESERLRNDIVFFYQGNRNPFIDNPQWVSRIWDTSGVGFFTPIIDTTQVEPTDTLNVDSVLFAYYEDLEPYEGPGLKDSLYRRIRNHTAYPYTSTNIDVWDILKETDKDTANPLNILLFYTGQSVDAAQEYNSGNGWTREHVWPRDHGGFSLAQGPGTDVHHIRPTGTASSRARGSLDFDRGGEPFEVDGDSTGNFSDGDSWEPRSEVKGDIARMLFYMATRYEGEGEEPDLELVDTVNTVASSLPGLGFHGKLSTLLAWHAEDPVDAWERRRNNVIYLFQGNRNPYIDHPEYVYRIWDPMVYDSLRTTYYAGIDTGLDAERLKGQLHALIDSQRVFNYTDEETDVWDILRVSDRDPADPENVVLFYSGWSGNAAQEFNQGRGWSREDIWSVAHGNLNDYPGVGTDAHAIRPVDISVNRARGDRDFDEGGTLYIDGDGDTGAYRDEDSWEPRDEVKGDVARMLFYMAVRYEGGEHEPDLELVDTVNTELFTAPGEGYHGKLSTLLKWHREDPVGRFERNRNQMIYEFQGNRNPFIDHPSFVFKVWDTTRVMQLLPDTLPDTVDIATSLAGEFASPALEVYPNPANEQVVIRADIPLGTSLRIHDIQGRVLLRETLLPGETVTLDTRYWAAGVYLVQTGSLHTKLWVWHP